MSTTQEFPTFTSWLANFEIDPETIGDVARYVRRCREIGCLKPSVHGERTVRRHLVACDRKPEGGLMLPCYAMDLASDLYDQERCYEATRNAPHKETLNDPKDFHRWPRSVGFVEDIFAASRHACAAGTAQVAAFDEWMIEDWMLDDESSINPCRAMDAVGGTGAHDTWSRRDRKHRKAVGWFLSLGWCPDAVHTDKPSFYEEKLVNRKAKMMMEGRTCFLGGPNDIDRAAWDQAAE